MLSKSIGEFRKWKTSKHIEKAKDMLVLQTTTFMYVKVISPLLIISDSIILHIKHTDNNTRYLTSNYIISDNFKYKLIIPGVSFLKIIVTIQRLTLKVRSLTYLLTYLPTYLLTYSMVQSPS